MRPARQGETQDYIEDKKLDARRRGNDRMSQYQLAERYPLAINIK